MSVSSRSVMEYRGFALYDLLLAVLSDPAEKGLVVLRHSHALIIVNPDHKEHALDVMS